MTDGRPSADGYELDEYHKILNKKKGTNFLVPFLTMVEHDSNGRPSADGYELDEYHKILNKKKEPIS